MRRIAFIVAAGLVVLGVVLWPRYVTNPTSGPTRTPIRNVVLISLDTTRADYLGCYGHTGSTTPSIDALAAEGVLFENVVAPVPLTLPSHVSMLTGTSPPYHGVHDNLSMSLRPDVQTLAEVLRNEGFDTAAVISALVLHRIYGLDQGFDRYRDGFRGATERSGDDTTRLAIEWLDELGDDRFFLFLHYYDPHFEYTPPEPFASRFPDDPYAGEIAFTDECVGKVMTRLKELGLYESTLIVIVGDHGEMLDEHGEPAHGYFVYRSALAVPLILRGPGLPASRRVQSIAGVVDITPTICSLLGVDPPSPQHGIDLAPLLDDDRHPDGDRYLYCESMTPTKYLASGLWGLVGERWKYIETTRPELYDVRSDPGEQRNRFSDEPDIAETLRDELEQRLASEVGVGVKTDLDDETLARLRSLGYVGGAMILDKGTIDLSTSDPKDLIEFHTRFVELQFLEGAGQLDRAQEIGQELLELRPDIPVVIEGMCGIALKRGDYDEAVEHCSRALAIDPDQFGATRDLGAALAALGRLDEAIESYLNALRIRPNAPRVHYDLAHVYYRRGEMDLALEHARVSARLNPDVAAVQVSLAVTYRELGRYEEALEHYYKVVKLEPTAVRHLNSIAWLLATTGSPTVDRTAEAVRVASSACAFTQYANPEFLETLAAALAAGGDFSMAIKRQESAIRLHRDVDGYERATRRLELYKVNLPLGEDD
ncbi:MAG: tetratricopeptide repeat protein [Planctomycetota bacterium]|nr:MAG: tetratricopeptide repeat protein [Planctomycetota bacterium]